MTSKIAMLPLSALAFASALIAGTNPASACGEDAYLGQVCIVGNTFCPRNTVEAIGQQLQVSANNALFAVMGCAFGGDCRSTFNLPDLRGRAPVQYGQGVNLTAHPFAQAFGQESVVQTVAMLPQHIHAATVTGSTGNPVQVKARQADATTNVPQAGYMLGQGVGGLDPAPTYVNPTVTSGTDVTLGNVSGGGAGNVTLNPTGAGAPTPTIPPEIAMRYCIVTSGIFPPRP